MLRVTRLIRSVLCRFMDNAEYIAAHLSSVEVKVKVNANAVTFHAARLFVIF